jgi:hypothetical protein
MCIRDLVTSTALVLCHYNTQVQNNAGNDRRRRLHNESTRVNLIEITPFPSDGSLHVLGRFRHTRIRLGEPRHHDDVPEMQFQPPWWQYGPHELF